MDRCLSTFILAAHILMAPGVGFDFKQDLWVWGYNAGSFCKMGIGEPGKRETHILNLKGEKSLHFTSMMPRTGGKAGAKQVHNKCGEGKNQRMN